MARQWTAGVRVTAAGWVYAGACVFVLIAMRNSGTNLLYFVFGLLMGALLVSFVFPTLVLRKIGIKRQFSDHIVAGEPADIVYEFTNRKRYWPTMAVRFEEVHAGLARAPRGFLLHVPQKGTVTVAAELLAKRRGVVRLETLRLCCGFPFGFLTRIVNVPCAQEMIVYPRIGMLNRRLALQYRESVETGTMTSNRRGGTDEFYGLREYRPGDNIRAIHWRSTARTGQVMMREMASNAPPQMIVVLNLRDWGRGGADESEAVERAIEVAASLICYGFFENFAVGLAIAGVDTDVPPSPFMGRDARAAMLRRLAVLDVRSVRRDAGILYPNKLAGRAEWIVVTLHQDDAWRDLVTPGGSVGASGGARRGSGGGQQTVLALDAVDAAEWVHFLTGQETLRLLRDREG